MKPKLTGLLGFGTAALLVFLAFELFEMGRSAGASSEQPTPAAAPVAPAEPSYAELRERYRKRLEDMANAKEEVKGPTTVAGPSQKDLAELHGLLKEREKRLSERETQLQEKERELREKERFLEQQLTKYETMLTKLRSEIKSLESTRQEKATAFRNVYERMEPKKAAKILDDMDTEVAGKILSGMKQQQAAEILAKMEPEKARKITRRYLSHAPDPDATAVLSP